LFRLNHKPALIEGTDELKWFNYETFAQPLEKVLNSKNSNKKKEKSVNKDRGWFYRKEVETQIIFISKQTIHQS